MAAKLSLVVFLPPGKHTQGQIQGVYALLLHRSSRRMIRGQESGLQLRRPMGGLKAQVLVAGCAVTLVLRLRQLIFSSGPVGVRSTCLAGQESQALLFLYEEPENFNRLFIAYFPSFRSKEAV